MDESGLKTALDQRIMGTDPKRCWACGEEVDGGFKLNSEGLCPGCQEMPENDCE